MEKNKSIDEILIGEPLGVLKGTAEEGFSAVVADQEMDGILCHFQNDNGVRMDTGRLAYICLDKDVLYRLILLIEEAERRYDKVLK